MLVVTLAMSGGVERFVTERCRAIREQGLFPCCSGPQIAGDARSCELWTDVIEVPNLRFEIPGELAALKSLLLVSFASPRLRSSTSCISMRG